MQKAVLYSFAATLAGLVSGGLLGLAGHFVPLTVRIAAASLLGLVAITVALLELNGRPIRPLQCNRETPQNWVHKGPTRWAIQNGLALGCGATNRIGFWLWYAVPTGAFLFASPWAGAAIYGVYSTTRGMAVWAIILGLARRRENWDEWLLKRKETARIVAAAQLLFLGIAVVIAVGL
ncbi:MAG: hypothetical protein H6656_22090 [Ardenticatenaceae bacterium]|nr:hypothetical protein [Ardenticatenaceae bacterium]